MKTAMAVLMLLVSIDAFAATDDFGGKIEREAKTNAISITVNINPSTLNGGAGKFFVCAVLPVPDGRWFCLAQQSWRQWFDGEPPVTSEVLGLASVVRILDRADASFMRAIRGT